MLWLFKTNFRGFRRFLTHGNTSYVVLYTQCLRYNICSVWFLDIRISTCYVCFSYTHDQLMGLQALINVSYTHTIKYKLINCSWTVVS